MAKTKKNLGRGLSALMKDARIDKDSISDGNKVNLNQISSEVLIRDIQRNKQNPRRVFEPKALEELKQSIKNHGLIQAITVRCIPEGYELISGERRLRACKELKLKTIPSYVIEVASDALMLELAIIENVQRDNLNPIEEANGYKGLIEEYDYTQEAVAERIGKDRSTITNMLRLLRLPLVIQDFLIDKRISMGHARALLGLDSSEKIISAADEVINKKLSVRATEKLVKSFGIDKQDRSDNKKNISDDVKVILTDKSDNLKQIFGTNVKITPKTNESGKIEIEYYSKEDFQRIFEILDK